MARMLAGLSILVMTLAAAPTVAEVRLTVSMPVTKGLERTPLPIRVETRNEGKRPQDVRALWRWNPEVGQAEGAPEHVTIEADRGGVWQAVPRVLFGWWPEHGSTPEEAYRLPTVRLEPGQQVTAWWDTSHLTELPAGHYRLKVQVAPVSARNGGQLADCPPVEFWMEPATGVNKRVLDRILAAEGEYAKKPQSSDFVKWWWGLVQAQEVAGSDYEPWLSYVRHTARTNDHRIYYDGTDFRDWQDCFDEARRHGTRLPPSPCLERLAFTDRVTRPLRGKAFPWRADDPDIRAALRQLVQGEDEELLQGLRKLVLSGVWHEQYRRTKERVSSRDLLGRHGFPYYPY